MKGRSFFTAALLLCSLLAACSSEHKSGSIIVASKQFTENVLLGEMYAQLIEARTDLEVVRKHNLGSPTVCIAAIENGEIDCYVDYTGTLYKLFLAHEDEPGVPAEQLYDLIKEEIYTEKGITIFEPIGLNNTFVPLMLEAKARSLGITTISDLVHEAPNLVFASNDDFLSRVNDGYNAMIKKYGLQFKSTVKMNRELLFEAVKNDQIDVVVAYATDSLLPMYEMVILEDDKGMFPSYYAIPVIRSEVLEKYPELNGVLNLLAGCIDDECMQELNYLVDIENQAPEDVAREFLEELGLL